MQTALHYSINIKYQKEELNMHHPRHFKCLIGTMDDSCTDNYLVKKYTTSRLTIATYFGHVKCIAELIEKYNVNINEVCEIRESFLFFRNSFPNGYCSLSIAIMTEKIDIIRFLISKGVDVNAVISDNSSSYFLAHYKSKEEIYYQIGGDGITPLMIACCMNNPDIETIRFLLDAGANVNGKTTKGCTALHICSSLGHLDILKLLIEEYGGNISNTNDSGMTSILNAALAGQTEIVEYLANQKKPIQISLKDRIDAFDILGATLIQNHRFSRGVEYWKKSFEMRYVEGVLTYDKIKNTDFSDEFREILTIRQLEEFQHYSNFLKIQSLLVKERILHPTHRNTFQSFEFVGYEFIEIDRDLGTVIKLWNHAINNVLYTKHTQQQQFDRYPWFCEYYNILEEYLHRVENNNLIRTIEDIFLILKMCKTVLSLEIPIPCPMFYSTIMHIIISCLKHLFAKFKENLTTHQWRFIKEMVKFHVEKYPRFLHYDGTSLLHMACTSYIISFDTSNSDEKILGIIELLLELGANPCSIDNRGNTPLHALDRIYFSDELKKDIANTLLLSGAHLDAVNKDRESFKNLKSNDREPIVNPLNYTSLQCLASSCIRKHGIPYNEKILPKIICKFIDMH